MDAQSLILKSAGKVILEKSTIYNINLKAYVKKAVNDNIDYAEGLKKMMEKSHK